MNTQTVIGLCPTCAIPGKPWKTIGTYCLLKCSTCDLIYLENQQADIAEAFFDDARREADAQANANKIEYWSYPQYFDKYKATFDGFFEKRLGYIAQVSKKMPDSLLDIGCGYGFFLEYAMRFVPSCHGVDLNETAIQSAKHRNLPVACRTAESLIDEQKRFDALILSDVLEHLSQPVETLRMCRQLLTEKGCLYIQVPNVIGVRIPYGTSLGLPHHIWQFSPKSLFAMLRHAGYRVALWNTGVMGVIGVLENGGPTLAHHLGWAAARMLRIGNRLQVVAVPA